LPALTPELAWDVVYGNFAVLLQVVDANIVNLPGDFNRDGNVDAADYVVWRKGLGTTFTLADYDLWLEHFGQTAGGGSQENIDVASNHAVPEPTSLILQIVGLAVVLFTRRCRKQLF